MKTTVLRDDFVEMLLADENASWTVPAAQDLFEYLERLEEDMGEELEVDPAAIRCQFTLMDVDEFEQQSTHFQQLAPISWPHSGQVLVDTEV